MKCAVLLLPPLLSDHAMDKGIQGEMWAAAEILERG